MTEFIINCIASGAYSAASAVLIVYIVRSNLKREGHYRRFITELCASLREVRDISGKLDDLIKIAESMAVKKKKPKPDYIQAISEYAGQVT